MFWNDQISCMFWLWLPSFFRSTSTNTKTIETCNKNIRGSQNIKAWTHLKLRIPFFENSKRPCSSFYFWNFATWKLWNVRTLKLGKWEGQNLWNFEMKKRMFEKMGNCIIHECIDHYWLMVHGSRLVAYSQEKIGAGARAWGTQRQIFLDHEPWVTCLEAWAMNHS